MDSEKQRNIWLFLGEYTPEKDGKGDLWDINPADKDTEALLYNNAQQNYVNTSQEKLNLSEGRLKRLSLLEFNTYHPSMKVNFDEYFEKDLQFDAIILLQAEHKDSIMELSEIEQQRLANSKSSSQANKAVVFNALAAINDFKRLEDMMWQDALTIERHKL